MCYILLNESSIALFLKYPTHRKLPGLSNVWGKSPASHVVRLWLFQFFGDIWQQNTMKADIKYAVFLKTVSAASLSANILKPLILFASVSWLLILHVLHKQNSYNSLCLNLKQEDTFLKCIIFVIWFQKPIHFATLQVWISHYSASLGKVYLRVMEWKLWLKFSGADLYPLLPVGGSLGVLIQPICAL